MPFGVLRREPVVVLNHSSIPIPDAQAPRRSYHSPVEALQQFAGSWLASCALERSPPRGSSNRSPLAFFRTSLSVLADASSRRNRSTSASSSFADRGVALTPTDNPSLPARSSLSQLNKLYSGISSLRLASEQPTLCANRTASTLHSFVYRRLGTPTFL
jgi:hypothetical protein